MTTSDRVLRASPAGDALKLALLQQALVMPLAGLILDGGGLLLVAAFAVAGYWGGVFLMSLRRRGNYTKFDLLLLRWGFFVLCLISFFVARWIWRFRGYEA